MEHPGLPAPTELEHQALDHIEELDRIEPDGSAEFSRAQALLERMCAALWPSVRKAIVDFAPHAPPADALAPATLEVAVREIDERPSRLLGLSTGRELLAEALGVDPEGGLQTWLDHEARALAPGAEGFALDQALRAWVRQAYLGAGGADKRKIPSPAARRLRCALVADFHPQVRAAALAAEQPEQVVLATQLVLAHPGDIEAQINGMAAVRAEDESKALAAGPPRRFTVWHLAFAVVIAALTLYQYLWR